MPAAGIAPDSSCGSTTYTAKALSHAWKRYYRPPRPLQRPKSSHSTEAKTRSQAHLKHRLPQISRQNWFNIFSLFFFSCMLYLIQSHTIPYILHHFKHTCRTRMGFVMRTLREGTGGSVLWCFLNQENTSRPMTASPTTTGRICRFIFVFNLMFTTYDKLRVSYCLTE